MDLKTKVWIGIGIGLIFCIMTIVIISQNNTIKKQKQTALIETQNHAADIDSLTEFSLSLADRAIRILAWSKKQTDSLNTIIGIKAQKIISLTSIIAELRHQISTDSGTTVVDSVTKEITYPLSDTSRFINYTGFVKIDSTGKGTHTLELWVDSLIISIPIYFDENGIIHASVKFNNDEFKVKSLESFLIGDLPYPTKEPTYNNIWKRFGLYTSTDLKEFEYGIVIRPFTLGRIKNQYKIGLNTTFYELMELIQ